MGRPLQTLRYAQGDIVGGTFEAKPLDGGRLEPALILRWKDEGMGVHEAASNVAAHLQTSGLSLIPSNPEISMTCNPRTVRCQTLFALSLSLTLIALWIFYQLPTSILPILIFIQWMPLIFRSGPISFKGRKWMIGTLVLLLLGVIAGIVRLLLGA